MATRKNEPSFDAMIKFFIQKYNLATKQDINRIERKLDDLEKTFKKQSGAKTTASRAGKGNTATEVVLNTIKDIGKDGASMSDVKAKTDYEDKKLRNIMFRLNKEGKIKRKKRGVYVAV